MTLQTTTADKINSLHQEIEAALNKSLENAIEIGRLLSQAKAEIPHGGFTGWLEENCTFSGRTARRYMKLFDNRDKIGSAEGIQDAYSMLQQPKTDTLSDFEEAEFAEAEAEISRNLETVKQIEAAKDKIKEYILTSFPGVRLPEGKEELYFFSSITLDEYIDKTPEPLAALRVAVKTPGTFDVRVFRGCKDEDYGYELHTKRGICLDDLDLLFLAFSGKFSFPNVYAAGITT